ncbi:MAG: FeoA family protein [Pseudomonadota bacterium]
MPSRPTQSTLAELSVGRSAVVASIDDQLTGVQRLMALGLVEGCTVTLVRRALGGDPLEISIRDAAMSVRKAEARHIRVNTSSTNS